MLFTKIGTFKFSRKNWYMCFKLQTKTKFRLFSDDKTCFSKKCLYFEARLGASVALSQSALC